MFKFEVVRTNDGKVVTKGEIDVEADPETTKDLNLTRHRICKVPDLSELKYLESLCLRWNLLKKIEGFERLVNLTTLNLYDNQITKIENLEALVNLETLDLSFNRIEKLEGLSTLTKLKTLYLVHNKIRKIEGLETLTQLRLLELGDNRIAKIENLEQLKCLKNLFLGANQIRKLEGLSSLSQLTCLSVPANALTVMEGLEDLNELEALYISQNGIQKIDGLAKNRHLMVLDLNDNRIEEIEHIFHLTKLKHLWLRNNKIADWKWVGLVNSLPKLRTVSFEFNPIYSHKPEYREKVLQLLPKIRDIDGVPALWKDGDVWQEMPEYLSSEDEELLSETSTQISVADGGEEVDSTEKDEKSLKTEEVDSDSDDDLSNAISDLASCSSEMHSDGNESLKDYGVNGQFDEEMHMLDEDFSQQEEFAPLCSSDDEEEEGNVLYEDRSMIAQELSKLNDDLEKLGTEGNEANESRDIIDDAVLDRLEEAVRDLENHTFRF